MLKLLTFGFSLYCSTFFMIINLSRCQKTIKANEASEVGYLFCSVKEMNIWENIIIPIDGRGGSSS